MMFFVDRKRLTDGNGAAAGQARQPVPEARRGDREARRRVGAEEGRLPHAGQRRHGDGVSALDDLIALRELPLRELAERLGIDPGMADPHRRYEGLEPVTALHDPSVSAATFYFMADGSPALIYLPRSAATGLSLDLGEPDARLRSRAGKRDMLWVYPGQGVAFSRNKDGLSFLEVFRPMSLEGYEHSVYREPPAFIR